jgi:TRAP-type C4-dicarboxylate transport system permease small subunit
MTRVAWVIGGLARVVERVALVVLLIGGLGMVLSTLAGMTEIVGVQILGIPVPGARELTESTMVLIVFGALAYTQVRRGHIRVEILYLKAGPRGRAVMDAVTHAAALVFFGLILKTGYEEVIFSLRINEATFGAVRFPLWPARIILVVGVALMMLRLVLDLMLDVMRIATGAPPPPAGSEALPDLPAIAPVSLKP